MSEENPYKRAYEIQKKAREEAERLLEDKSRELYEKNQSLQQALDELAKKQEQLVVQEKLASIGQLGAGLAHELNNPNAFIQNNLNTLREYTESLLSADNQLQALSLDLIKDASPEQQNLVKNKVEQIRRDCEVDYIEGDLQQIFHETEQGTQRITNIANGLRYFTNPEDTSKRDMDSLECIHQAQRLISEQELKNVKIEVQSTDVPVIKGLPILMAQALSNIIKNALDAEPKSHQINISLGQTNSSIVITISDDGIGMTPDVLKNASEPFFTTDKSKNGLGLAIVQNIISQHQGKLEIESEHNHGTKVTISLPIT